MVFVHELSPFLLRIHGDFGIRWYSLVYIAGFIASYLFFSYMAKAGRIKNLKQEMVEKLLLYIILGVVIGARLGHVFGFEAGYYFSNPMAIVMVWQGGLSFHGGLAGLAFAIYYFCKKNRIRFYQIADGLSIVAPALLFFGRIANFINGELYGTVSSSGFCVDYSKNRWMHKLPEGCRHPTPLYEAAKNMAIFFFLYVAFRKKKLYGTGFFTWAFIGSYGLLRFLITYYRDEPLISWLGISQSQLLSALMFLTAIIVAGRNEKIRNKIKHIKKIGQIRR